MQDKIQADLKAAMLARDSLRVETLKMIKTALQMAAIDKGELTEEQAIKIIQKEAQQRTEAAQQYETAGNSEMAEKERAEKDILAEYLPEQLEESEIDTIIADAISKTNASTIKDMGAVMGIVNGEIAGRADPSMIAQKVKQKLT